MPSSDKSVLIGKARQGLPRRGENEPGRVAKDFSVCNSHHDWRNLGLGICRTILLGIVGDWLEVLDYLLLDFFFVGRPGFAFILAKSDFKMR